MALERNTSWLDETSLMEAVECATVERDACRMASLAMRGVPQLTTMR